MKDFIQGQIERYRPSNQLEYNQALRELLQKLILMGLWRGKFFEHAAFYGETALRILHGLDRFSEDLDFTLLEPNEKFSWERYQAAVVDELQSYGFNVEMVEKKKNRPSPIRSAFVKTSTSDSLLYIGAGPTLTGIHPEAMTKIRVEVDTVPPLGVQDEQRYMKHPFVRAIRVVTKPGLFAGKVHAALYRGWKNRVKGRDWWDIIWFIRCDTPIDLKYLANCMKEEKALTKEWLIQALTERIEEIDIASAQQDIKPFIKDKTLVDEWSPDFFVHWIEQIRVKK